MTRPIHVARLGAALLFGVLLAGCGKTPTAPTPTPEAPPVISCPASQSLTSALAAPMSVVYSLPSVVGGTAPITTLCTPASGSTFPLGTTTVTCTATDAQRRVSSCSLTVAVASPARIRLTKFVAFGDSITYGEDGQNSLTSEVGGRLTFLRSVVLFGREYPTVLRGALVGRYPLQTDAISVTNQGNPGERAGDSATLTRFSTTIAATQVVLLMQGSNDLYDAYTDGSQASEAALVNLQKMVRSAKVAGVVPYLATVPPMNPNACTPRCRGFAANLVSPFDDRVRLLAASEGVTLVDVYKAFNGDLTLLSVDGLHPNASGYERIADTFFQAIKATLELPTTLGGASGQLPIPLVGY